MSLTAVGLAAAALLFSGPGRAANGVTLEGGGGQSTPQPTVQPSPFEYQRLVGRYEPTDSFYLSASVRLQHDFPSAPFPGTTLHSGDDWVWSGTLDASYDAAKHVTIGLGLNGSAPSTRDIAAQFLATSNAIMHATSDSAGGTADLTLDTFDPDGPSRSLDGSLGLSLGYTHFWTTQALTELDTPAGPTLATDLLGKCAKRTTALCDVVSVATRPTSADLGQLRLGATATGTLYEHTDLSVDVAYYLYDQENPDQVGFFTYTPAGTTQKETYGAGLPLIPPRWTLRPELAHKWKVLSARVWYQFANYTLSDYDGHTVGAKVQLYLGNWRLYASGNYRADVSPGGTQASAQSWTAGLGLTRQF